MNNSVTGPPATITLRSGRQVRSKRDASNEKNVTYGDDLWDFIHYNCPLSRLEAEVLVGRYIMQRGEKELARDLGVPWRRLNRAAWRLKLKLRTFQKQLGLSPAMQGNGESIET